MMNKKKIGLLALLATALLAGNAFAANRVEVKVTSEPIAQYATCEKAGGYTMEFDRGTIINHGDQFTVDLPLNVTLCNDVDIVIPYGGVNTGAAFGAPAATSAVLAGADTAYFKVYGEAGTQRVTIDVFMADAAAPATAVPAATLTVTDADADGDATLDKFTLAFFDQNIDGIYVWNDADSDDVVDAGEYVAGAMEDNTRCINVSAYNNETVSDSLDSKLDKYTFIPSNPQVAHIVASTTYSIVSCDKTEVGNIELGDYAGQGGTDDCEAFDFETGASYCDSEQNKLIINSSANMADVDYSIELEILTDGVYWSNQNVGYESFATKTAACEDLATASSVAADRYLNADGVSVAGAAPVVAGANSCTLAASAKAKVLEVDSVALVSGASKALWLDMPAFNYDLSEISEGDEVQVKVTVRKVPCGEIISDTISVGILGCEDPVVSNSITFPYFTEINGDSFWDGFAIVNMSSTDGTANLRIYEADGDQFTATLDVDANSMAVHNTADLLSIASGSGTLGDSRFYMEVRADFNVDGFAMMANPTTGESMGYLPRK